MPELAPAERPLRIALLTHSVNPRGGVVHTLELASALQASGHEVVVHAPARAGERLFRDVPCEVRLLPLPAHGTGLRTMVQSRIEAYVDGMAAHRDLGAFDILHAHDGIGGNALATLADHGRIPGFVRTVHHLDRFDDAQVMAWQTRSVLAAEQLLSVSRVWRERLVRDHGRDAIEVRNGVDLRRYRPTPQRDDALHLVRLGLDAVRDPAAPVVLAVGGVEQRKNTLRLLEAFLQLRERRPRARLVIAGGASLLDHDAYARSFAAALDAAGLAAEVSEPCTLAPTTPVRLLGPVPDAAMPALFRRADVLAMPSLREGFGLVVLEALASGTPVVVSELAPFTEYLDERLADFADPLLSRSIAAALERALSRPRLDPLMSPADGLAADRALLARALLERYSWSASARRHIDIYRGVIAARPRRRPSATSLCTMESDDA